MAATAVADMEIVVQQEYTIPHKQPRVKPGDKISKRAAEQLPNFTCHVYVPSLESLFAGRQNGEIVQWKLERGKEGRLHNHTVIGRHIGGVTCMLHAAAFDKFVITGSSDSTMKVWDVFGTGIEGNRCIQTIPAHNATVTALAAHCDVVLSCSCDKTLKVWKAEEGRAALKYPWLVVRQLFVFDYWTTCVWAFPSKIAEDTMGEVYVGDAGGGLTMLRSVAAHHADSEKVAVDELRVVRPHVRNFRALGVTCVLPVPALNVVLTCTYDDAVRLSDISTIETLVSLGNAQNPGSRFVAMVWASSQEELVLADADGTLSLWNSRMDRFVASTRGGHRVAQVSVESVGGRHVVVASTLEAVKIFAVKRSLPYKRHTGHTQRVLGMQLYSNPDTAKDPGRPDDRCLMSASVDNTICCWSVRQAGLQRTRTLTEKYNEISAFLYLGDERVAVTGHENGSLKIWNLANDKTWRVAGHSNTVSAIAAATHRYTPHGTLEERPHVVTASFDGHLALWEITRDTSAHPKCDLRWPVCRDELLAVVYDPLKHHYIAAGNAGEITVWSLADPVHPAKVGAMLPAAAAGSECNDCAVTALALDGNYLFSGGEDEVICMWDTHSQALLRVLRDDGELNALFVVPATGHLLSCTRAGGVKLWSQKQGRVLARFDSPISEELRCLAYCRETSEVFVGTEDGAVLRVTLALPEAAEAEAAGERMTDGKFVKVWKIERECVCISCYGF